MKHTTLPRAWVTVILIKIKVAKTISSLRRGPSPHTHSPYISENNISKIQVRSCYQFKSFQRLLIRIKNKIANLGYTTSMIGTGLAWPADLCLSSSLHTLYLLCYMYITCEYILHKICYN